MNCELLREAILKSNIKKKAFKEALGVTYSTLQRKLNGESDLTWKEICIISNLLKLNDKEKMLIFFTQ